MLNKIIFSFTVFTLFSSFRSFAQENEEKEEKTWRREVEWAPAFIVMRSSGDTIHGTMSTPRIKTQRDWVNFYTTNKNEVRKYKSDSISAFQYKETYCRYFEYSGWSILIRKGPIDVYKGQTEISGSVATGVGTSVSVNTNSECLVFKKGSEKAKFIGAEEIKPFSGGTLKQKTKTYFAEYIADDSISLAEFNKEDFKYADLEYLIEKYNYYISIKK